MTDFISRKRIEFELCESNMPFRYRDFCRRVINSEELSPSIELQPVVHGHWITKTTSADAPYTICSHCNTSVKYNDEYGTVVMNLKGANYCPNCGARMDKKIYE